MREGETVEGWRENEREAVEDERVGERWRESGGCRIRTWDVVRQLRGDGPQAKPRDPHVRGCLHFAQRDQPGGGKRNTCGNPPAHTPRIAGACCQRQTTKYKTNETNQRNEDVPPQTVGTDRSKAKERTRNERTWCREERKRKKH